MGTSEAVIETAEKRGFGTGLEAVHPFDPNRRVPVYVANFVLMEYGTGAIFGCPAHDQRDLDFARKYGLPVIPVVLPPGADPATVRDRRRGLRRGRHPVQFGVSSTACRWPRPSAPPASGSRRWAAASARSPIGCAIGACRGSAIGAARSRSSIAPDCGIVPVPESESAGDSCRWMSASTCRAIRSITIRPGSMSTARAAAARRSARPTRSIRSSIRPGISCASARRARRSRSPARRRHYWMPVDQYIGGDRARRAASALFALLHPRA